MRTFGWFMTAIVGALLAAALLAYPLYLLIHPLEPAWWFDKIATRLFQLLMLGAVVLLVRHLQLTSKRDWGYGAPRPRWLRQFAVGLIAGLATMLPVSLSMIVLGARVVDSGLSGGALGHALLAGLGSGLAVGFLEETFFRGLMQGAVVRDMQRPLAGIVLVSVVYAALHFLARARIPHEQVSWHSGLDLLAGVLANFAAPAGIIDSFLALLAIGVLLGLIAWWTGSIALSAGLHAGWVWMMRATVSTTSLGTASPMQWLISQSDGYTGWLVVGWTVVIIFALVLCRGRFRGWRRLA